MSKRTETATATTEKTNMVFLAGTLKFDPKSYETQIRALVDVGQKSAIQVSIYTGETAPRGNAQLADKLARFRHGDFIKLVAMLRPYGVKQEDDTWRNNISIEVTEIKNEPPNRQRESKATDDDMPF